VEGRGGEKRCFSATRTGAKYSHGGRAGWIRTGSGAVLIAHVPEPSIIIGGRAGWVRSGHGVVLIAHVPEPNIVMVEGRGG
jgi:hypothetical protein